MMPDARDEALLTVVRKQASKQPGGRIAGGCRLQVAGCRRLLQAALQAALQVVAASEQANPGVSGQRHRGNRMGER